MTDQTPAQAERKDKKEETNPRQLITYGIILLLFAVGAYFYLHAAEQSGGTVRMPVILIPVYEFLGTGGIVAVLAGLGLLSLGLAANDLRPSKRAASRATATAAALPEADQA